MLYPYWERYKEEAFSRQKTTRAQIEGFLLEFPASHPMPSLMKCQPYRDAFIGALAKHVGGKYPHSTMIDIGANVGDTAALICGNCGNDLILIEASHYYFTFLERNALQFPNRVTLENAFLADGSPVNGRLCHWGGTAIFSEGDGECVCTKRLCEITNKDVRFIKSDTDGYDFKIFLDSISWLAVQHPVIVFEDYIRTSEEMQLANRLCAELHNADYNRFMVWDDSGLLILATSSLETLRYLHSYGLNVRRFKSTNAISNYDVACFHACDEDIFAKVLSYYASL